jgi:hypothetical protein
MITLLSQPTTFLQSAGNNSVYTISGSNYLAPNVTDWQAICQIYINGNLATTQKGFSSPVYPGYSSFDMRNIVSNFVSYDFPYIDSTSSIFATASNSSCLVQLVFSEQYTLGSVFSQSVGLASSSVFAYINSSLPYVNQITTNLNDYLQTGTTGSLKKFLASGSNSIETYTNLRNHLYFYNSGSIAGVNVSTYDSNNVLIGIYTLSNPYSSSVGVESIGVGYPTLNNLLTSSYSVVSGSVSLINLRVNYYTVNLFNGSSQICSETFTYTLGQLYDRWSQYSINCYFLNEMGGMSEYKFQKKNQTSFNKTVSTYKRLPGQLQASGQFKFNTYDRQESNYFTAITSMMELNSDWISDIDSLALIRNLFGSPIIFLEDSNGVLQAANLKEDSYKINKKEIEKLYQVTFNMQLSQTDYRQQI